ncbi:MAG TPA: hypothetical protein VK625_05085, partial [Flavitalea sp.]|nr:hypothetical protein [Flavitalea sp.]
MKRFFRLAGVTILIILLVLLLVIQTMHNRKFDAPYPAITSTTDTATIARGKQLVFGAAHCVNCHSPKDAK